jgi:hypothetical protein
MDQKYADNDNITVTEIDIKLNNKQHFYQKNFLEIRIVVGDDENTDDRIEIQANNETPNSNPTTILEQEAIFDEEENNLESTNNSSINAIAEDDNDQICDTNLTNDSNDYDQKDEIEENLEDFEEEKNDLLMIRNSNVEEVTPLFVDTVEADATISFFYHL